MAEHQETVELDRTTSGDRQKLLDGRANSDQARRPHQHRDDTRTKNDDSEHKNEDKSSSGKTEDGDGKGAEDNKDDSEDQTKNDPNRPSLIRRHPLAFILVILLLIAAAIAGFIWWQNSRHFESTDDAFITARQFVVAAKANGYITNVNVTDNQLVNAGDVLAVIDDRDYRTSLAQVEAQLAQAEASIPNIDAQIASQQAQIAQSEAQIADARASATLAEEENVRYQQLAITGSGSVQRAQQTRASLLQAHAAVTRTIAGVNAAQKQLSALLAQRISSEANIVQAKAQRDQANTNLGYTVVKADQAGRIVQLTAARGQLVQSGQTLMILVPSPLWVVANFRETQIEDMKPGQPVDIRIDAYSKRTFKGHIDSVQSGSGTAFSLLPAENATGNYVKVVQRVPVKIVFDEQPDVVVGPGMSVVPKARVR